VNIRTKLISSFGVLLLIIILVFGAITYLTFADIIGREGEEVLQLKAQQFLLDLHKEMGREYQAFHEAHNRWRGESEKDGAVGKPKVEPGGAAKEAQAGFFGPVQIFAGSSGKDDSSLQGELLPAFKKEFETRTPGPGLRLVRVPEGIFLGELLQDRNGRVDGVLAARLDLELLRSFLAVNRNVDQALLTLSFHGYVLATSAPGDADSFHPRKIASLLDPTWERPNHVLSVDNCFVLTSEKTRQGLQISYILPGEVFLKDLSALKNRILAAILVLGYLAVWMVLVISHRITRPIVDLSRASRDITSFNYETPVTILSRHDEIGMLGESFETMRRKIKELVIRDPLTRTYNRRFLLHTLETAVSKAVRRQEDLAAIMLDLDHFKSINDRYGHRCGDAVLEAMGDLLLQEVRPYDTVARYGGEEFTVILPNTDAAMAFQVAERLRKKTEDFPFSWEDETVRCTLSLGLSVLREEDGLSYDPLIERADKALYAAKAAGRNRTVVHQEEEEA
jgi:diguanylate cyclase (GGDEF)-like protein